MNAIKTHLKVIPIIEEFMPSLEKEFQKWNGKVMNKKFYEAIEDFCNAWYEKAFPENEQPGYKVQFYAKDSYIRTTSRVLELNYENQTYTLVSTWYVKEWQTKEEGKQPRVNAAAIINNLHKYSTARKEKLTRIENTLANQKDIMKAYETIVKLAVYISQNKFDTETMIHDFRLDTKTLDHINNVKYAGDWLKN